MKFLHLWVGWGVPHPGLHHLAVLEPLGDVRVLQGWERLPPPLIIAALSSCEPSSG